MDTSVEQKGKPVPRLNVVCTGGANIGRCYNASYFTIITAHELTDDDIKTLKNMGVLGSGQEFSTLERNTKKKASEVYGDEYVTRRINEYSGKMWASDPDVYVTKCERRVDSSG